MKLTVGIPVYNEKVALMQAVASVINQSWKGQFEILIVDDGSTDGTVDAVAQISKLVPQIRLVRHPRNLGRPAARTTLAREARGQYFAMLDADDEWFPDKLKRQFEYLERLELPEAQKNKVMICGNILHVDIEGGKERVKNFAESYGKQGYGIERVLKGDNTPISQLALMQTDFLRHVGAFDDNLKRAQDWDFLIRFFDSGGSIYFVPGSPIALFNFKRVNRNADLIERSMHCVIEKHSALYARYKIDPEQVRKSISEYINGFKGVIHVA